jgi:hypothetical protein
MRVHSLSFDTWCRNHADSHRARWCRELYPWDVFPLVDYAPALAGADQRVRSGGAEYTVRLLEHWVGGNGRNNVLFHLASRPSGRGRAWEHRHWDDTFQLVAEPDGYFITLFTKKKDPSERVLADFMSGRFERVAPIRSMPLSALLFRSVLTYGAEQAFGPMAAGASFPTSDSHGAAQAGPTTFAPFLSQGRSLWIGYAFTEENAHRFAIRNAPHCDRLVVAFCRPTFTRHHRCDRPSAQVVSLPGFLDLASAETRRRYMPHARFLLNNLIHAAAAAPPSAAAQTLAGRISSSGRERMPIHTSAVREARAGLGVCVQSAADCAYFFACANLLNAALNPNLGLYAGSLRLCKEVYSFKSVVAAAIEGIVAEPIDGVSCYFDPDGTAYVTVLGVQFSFHAIPRTSRIAAYIFSGRNVPQPWSGVRLQPIAPLVLEWASALAEQSSPRSTGP